MDKRNKVKALIMAVLFAVIAAVAGYNVIASDVPVDQKIEAVMDITDKVFDSMDAADKVF